MILVAHYLFHNIFSPLHVFDFIFICKLVQLQESLSKAELLGLREEELARFERKKQSTNLRIRVTRSQALTFQKIRVYEKPVGYTEKRKKI